MTLATRDPHAATRDPHAANRNSHAPDPHPIPGWHVVYTKPRQECVAEENLLRQRYETWLPTIGKWTRRAAGWTCDTQPMFPRYLFLRTCDAQQSLAPVRSTLGAIGLVHFGERAPTVSCEIVDALRRLASDTREPPHPLRPGARVRVVAGPLAGLQALVTASAAHRVEIFLQLLGRDARACVQPEQLEPHPA
ncbi:MAG: transcriptional activator RfaH [Burkholderiaceae bacterium]|nr:transcriptional activator RfaH [Burkholderiaceae bacterium]